MWEKIKFLASGIYDFLKPFINLLLSKAGPVLMEAALSAVTVTAINLRGQSSTAKRDAAYSQIVTDLKEKGIQVGVDVTVSAINAALETAYQKFQAK